MTVSKRFKFRFAGRGLRRMFFRAGRENGSSLVEFGLIVPVLSMFLLGIVYGGITFYDDLMLADAVAVGARAMAAGQGDVTVCTDAYTALTNAAYGLNTAQIWIVKPPQFTMPTTTGSTTGTSSCSVTTGKNQAGTACSATAPCQMLVTGELATITATYPCSMYFPKLGINLCPVQGVGTGNPSPTCPYSAYCIVATATERIE